MMFKYKWAVILIGGASICGGISAYFCGYISLAWSFPLGIIAGYYAAVMDRRRRDRNGY